jgi:hypothetical protein
MMFVMTFPAFVDTSSFAVKSSGSVEALWLMSILSFVANVAVFVYQVKRIRTRKMSPIHDEIYTDIPAYDDVAKLNISAPQNSMNPA